LHKFNILIIPCLFLITNLLIAQEVEDKIFLKNSSIVPFKIKEIHSWGLVDDSKRPAPYHVIDSVKTSDKSVVIELIDLLDSIKVENYSNYSILDLTNYSLKPSEKKDENNFLINRSMLIELSSKISSLFGMQYNYSLRPLNMIIQRIAFTFGHYSSDRQFSSVNFQYGLGIQYEFERSSMLWFINYARNFLFARDHYRDGSDIYYNCLFLNFTLQTMLDEGRRYMMSFGLNYYISNYEPEKTMGGFSFTLGIGLNLEN